MMTMENSFGDLFNSLNSKDKSEISVSDFETSREGFILYLDDEEFNKISKSDIAVFNHYTGQYRIFEFSEQVNENEKIFKVDNIFLKFLRINA